MASNVYAKLNQARIKMQEFGLKQTGVNDFAKYKYFELEEILPVNNKICAEINATTICNFTADAGVLYFIDCDKPEDRIAFTSPMSSASLKGCHEVQNLGAVETYIKRYLYQNLYELSERDVLDMSMNPGESNQPSRPAKPTKQGKTAADPESKAALAAEAEQVVKRFEELAGKGLIAQDSLDKMHAAYADLKGADDYKTFMANARKNIQQAEKALAEVSKAGSDDKDTFKDDDIPF